MSMVKCPCENEYQDRVYGKGNRVANANQDKSEHECTVCGLKHRVGDTALYQREVTFGGRL